MKRFLIVFMILGLTVGSLATAEAKKIKRVERTVEGSYGPYPAPVTGCNSALEEWTCMTIHTGWSENFFTAKVNDAHGQPVFVEVYAGDAVVARFCGETAEPVPFQPGSSLRFYVALNLWLVSLDCPAHRIKTTGTITVTLSNVP